MGKIDNVKSLAISASRTAQASKRQQVPIRRTLVRAAVARFVCFPAKRDPLVFAEEQWKSGHVADAILSPGAFVSKAVTNPAMTSVAGWAADLLGTSVGMLASLAPTSVFAALSARALGVELAAMGNANLPYRVTPGSVPNPFIGEGLPLPVRQFQFAANSLRGYKAGAISLFSAEMAKRSVSSLETILGRFLEEDIAAGIDAVLLGNAPASASQPAGLLNGVTATTASTGTGLEALIADISALLAAVPNVADPTLIVSPADFARAALLAPNLGGGLSIIASENVPAGKVILVDAADIAVASENDGTLDITEDASVHSAEPALPIATGTAGAGADTAAPHTSLFQTNLLGIRTLESVSWAMRRPGRVAFIEAVAW
ncbi:phage major capsid protein [Ensifer sp.]|uniref:phage major capsid protein n=1 Tax=Ensifer sp. TaxID=1872086 RepID=UPI0028A072B3|nr:phage major capsid protein [Ensifer sp.]